ncbi:MAG: sulfotransferase [Streptosporangiaceae bacterium]
MIVFISGFNRSGTTVLLEAVAAATGGTPFTVGDLIRHGTPELAARLSALVDSPNPVDRGVDPRPVTRATPEEYGWLLVDRKTTRSWTSRFNPAATGQLSRIADELQAVSGIAVMKNPSDTSREAMLLRSFPEARVLVTRRSLAGIMASTDRALSRALTSTSYGIALTGDSRWIRFAMWAYRIPAGARLFQAVSRWNLRLRVLGLLYTAPRLPIDRVAFLDYDELVDNPGLGAHWAAHVLDSEELDKEFHRAHTFAAHPSPPASRLDRLLDRRWGRVWSRARAEQLRLGILKPYVPHQ